MTTFGISLGTRQTGVCIIKDEVLYIAQVHNFIDPWSRTKLTKIINRYREYIKKYNVTDIMVKVPHSSQQKGSIKELMDKVVALAKEYGCDIDFITKDELKGFTRIKKTAELLDWTRRQYPDLNAYYERALTKSKYYYEWSFEAVLAAHVYQKKKVLRVNKT
ncbi:hypothetical protein [Mucilaginibacter flavus]|uniref:hypothetical protein n=1 Tax=Mucilaginibacter flavus TaxID=931504 RepID=UPI0025B5A3C4|nr:hypothetical protein [Mucilaginibacter flavus]MDN3581878.1 hypothetical protein [Mucilaginibacter flavus]